MQNRKKSETYFHIQPENFNCAQAILKGFQNEFSVSEQEIEEYRAWGGGRAQDGVCGALFAAKRLTKGDDEVAKEFEQTLGSVYCKELKRDKSSCVSCVKLADELVEKRLKQA